jgi:hypothetical protein
MIRSIHTLGLVALVALMSCGALDTVIDCQAICARYSSCFDAAYSVVTCTERCRVNSTENAEYRRRADPCNACIDERACTSATFNCTTTCADVVP